MHFLIRQRQVCLLWLVAFGLLLCSPNAANSYGSDWLDPAAEWNDWMPIDNWETVTIRGQDATALPAPKQPTSVEGRRGNGGFSDRQRRLAEARAIATGAMDTASAEDAPAEPVAETPTEKTAGSEQSLASDYAISQPPEIAQVIKDSKNVQTTEFQKRSQLALDPNIRGYQGGSVYTQSDNAYWAPIRPDLDSIINRLDPSLYESVSVIPGPYGLRYGPGFAFMRVLNVDTPRNPNGYESNFRTGISTRTNGGQIYGRQSVFGGGTDWGYIFNYGNRVGGDYDPGGNSALPPVPGSYKSQSLLGQVGLDLSPESSLEFRVRRLDDTDTQYPLQFFDVNYMGIGAYSLSYNCADPCGNGTFSLSGWYSRSKFNGDTLPAEPNSPYYSVARVNAALDGALGQTGADLYGNTFGHMTITGARINKTWGDPDLTLLSIGADFRYMTQRIEEQFQINGVAALPEPNFSTNLPNSNFANPGAYSELTLRWLDYLSTTVGGRVDWVHTSTDPNDFRQNGNLEIFADEVDQNDVLYGFYVSNELQLNSNWTTRLAGGYSQRPPTMLERYADGVFVSVAQSGLTRVIGTPTLKKESLWQIDASLEAEYERWGGRIGGFYSWVDDPITYLGFPVKDLTGAYLLRYINGNQFLRSGFEAAFDWDVTDMITAFGTARYTWGEDRGIHVDGEQSDVNVPLIGIYPFSSEVGIRIHDADGGNRWGLEFAALMVDGQDRDGYVRLGSTSVLALDPEFETQTPGFTVFRLGGYFNVTDNLYVVGGVDNLFDRTYLDHLNQRLIQEQINGQNFSDVAVLSPGITPYFGFEWNY